MPLKCIILIFNMFIKKYYTFQSTMFNYSITFTDFNLNLLFKIEKGCFVYRTPCDKSIHIWR